jgi:Helix-turn-helix
MTDEGYGVCELCFQRAAPAEIASAAIHLPDDQISTSLDEKAVHAGARQGSTIVAFVLATHGSNSEWMRRVEGFTSPHRNQDRQDLLSICGIFCIGLASISERLHSERLTRLTSQVFAVANFFPFWTPSSLKIYRKLPWRGCSDYMGTNAPWQVLSTGCTFGVITAISSAVKVQRGESQVKLDERSIYPNLKLTIYKTGIRQNRLARMVGIHEAYLSRIVNGSREPGDALRQAIANALHSDVEWLFEREKVVAFPTFIHEDRQAS